MKTKFRIIEIEGVIRIERKKLTSWEKVRSFYFGSSEAQRQCCIDAAKTMLEEIKKAKRNIQGDLIIEECEI